MTIVSKPQRIQRQRTKGWRMPEGVVYVGRPSKWGNPTSWEPFAREDGETPEYARQLAAEAFEDGLVMGDFPGLSPEQAKAELAGKDLACWCRLDHYCHADILLKIANAA